MKYIKYFEKVNLSKRFDVFDDIEILPRVKGIGAPYYNSIYISKDEIVMLMNKKLITNSVWHIHDENEDEFTIKDIEKMMSFKWWYYQDDLDKIEMEVEEYRDAKKYNL
jgi:hypothetical protein